MKSNMLSIYCNYEECISNLNFTLSFDLWKGSHLDDLIPVCNRLFSTKKFYMEIFSTVVPYVVSKYLNHSDWYVPVINQY